MEFARGAIQNRNIEEVNGVSTSPITVTGDTELSGTEVHFLADVDIFGHVEFHYEILVKPCEVSANIPRVMKPKCEIEVKAISELISFWPIAKNAP